MVLLIRRTANIYQALTIQRCHAHCSALLTPAVFFTPLQGLRLSKVRRHALGHMPRGLGSECGPARIQSPPCHRLGCPVQACLPRRPGRRPPHPTAVLLSPPYPSPGQMSEAASGERVTWAVTVCLGIREARPCDGRELSCSQWEVGVPVSGGGCRGRGGELRERERGEGS